jgi:hypothetical protein
MTDPVSITAISTAAAFTAANSKEIIKEVYGDALKPATAAVGKAIGACLSIVTAPLLWADEAVKIRMAGHLNRLSERIDMVPPERVVEARPEVAVPILEKLRHTAEPSLADMFIELLGKACDLAAASAAHPAFPGIVGSLAPDEARFLQFFVANESLPWGQPFGVQPDGSRRAIGTRQTLPAISSTFAYPEYESVYLSNLEGLRLIEIVEAAVVGHPFYAEFLARCSADPKYIKRLLKGDDLGTLKGQASLTDFGRLFMRACAP